MRCGINCYNQSEWEMTEPYATGGCAPMVIRMCDGCYNVYKQYYEGWDVKRLPNTDPANNELPIENTDLKWNEELVSLQYKGHTLRVMAEHKHIGFDIEDIIVYGYCIDWGNYVYTGNWLDIRNCEKAAIAAVDSREGEKQPLTQPKTRAIMHP